MWTPLLLLACGQSASVPTPAEEAAPAGVAAPAEEAAPAGEAAAEEETAAPAEDQASQAPITIDAPQAGATLSPGENQMRGSASSWEGMVSLQIRRGEEILAEGSAQATEAAPGRGLWETTLVLPASPGPAVLEAFTRSPRDGSPQQKVEVAVVLD